MPGQLSGRDENRVEPNPELRIGRICGEKMVEGARDARLLTAIDGVGRRVERRAGLDLHRHQQAPAPGDQVDLADRTAMAAGENPIALEAQKPGSMAFGPVAAPFGGPTAFRRPPRHR